MPPKKAVEVEAKTEETVRDEVFEPLAIAEGEALDMFTEQALISIAPVGEGELLYETLTTSLDPDIGEKGVDFIPNCAAGRITKFLPMDDNQVTLDIYTTDAGTATWPSTGTGTANKKVATGAFGLFQTEDTAQPVSYTITSLYRQKVRLTILWTDAASLTMGAALGALTTSQNGLRISFAGGYVTKIKPAFDPSSDGLKFTLTVKFPAMNKAGTGGLCLVESNGGTASLTALAPFTTTTMFR